MDCKGMEKKEIRSRIFRYEDYNNRRVFLRSYPLHWGEEEEEEEEEVEKEKESLFKQGKEKKDVKKIFSCVLHWGGGKVLVLKKFKHKMAFYLVACHPFRFIPPHSFDFSLISLRMEKKEIRSRIFRYEDYNNRRVFLRSYPLQWGEEEEEEEEEVEKEKESLFKQGKEKKDVKKIFSCVLHWGGGKVLFLKKFKHKMAFYLVACHPFRFIPHTPLISV
ncbi:hypothetical protein HHK36_031750 [Tetracentron sinense]|uniref:Uncharacterized protein n=1 Tax=Tetracentron sinense TaxID=13715 RepID=A0A834YBK8_TETSI|nr:hypothetical protein HHK36_031750 [Tetracentron sinense]